jgi:hypothetical protein
VYGGGAKNEEVIAQIKDLFSFEQSKQESVGALAVLCKKCGLSENKCQCDCICGQRIECNC